MEFTLLKLKAGQLKTHWVKFMVVVGYGIAAFAIGNQGPWRRDLFLTAWDFYGFALLAVAALAAILELYIWTHKAPSHKVTFLVHVLTIVLVIGVVLLILLPHPHWGAAGIGLGLTAFAIIVGLFVSTRKAP